ncbi:mCG147100 [Mus musculus]|nr:mCG147100 [Mus musculus]
MLHLGPVHLPLQSILVALLFVLLLLRLRVLKRKTCCLFVREK